VGCTATLAVAGRSKPQDYLVFCPTLLRTIFDQQLKPYLGTSDPVRIPKFGGSIRQSDKLVRLARNLGLGGARFSSDSPITVKSDETGWWSGMNSNGQFRFSNNLTTAGCLVRQHFDEPALLCVTKGPPGRSSRCSETITESCRPKVPEPGLAVRIHFSPPNRRKPSVCFTARGAERDAGGIIHRAPLFWRWGLAHSMASLRRTRKGSAKSLTPRKEGSSLRRDS
jgi:hypothetical protein